MSTVRTDDATADELYCVLSAARRLLERVDLDGARTDTRSHISKLRGLLDSITDSPTTTMAGIVESSIDRIANPDAVEPAGMTVGDALVSMARLGMYPAELLAGGGPDEGDTAQHDIDRADAAQHADDTADAWTAEHEDDAA